MKAINKARTNKVIQEIRNVILNWDFEKYGNITQAKVRELSKCAKGTVEKYLNQILHEIGITKKELQ